MREQCSLRNRAPPPPLLTAFSFFQYFRDIFGDELRDNFADEIDFVIQRKLMELVTYDGRPRLQVRTRERAREKERGRERERERDERGREGERERDGTGSLRLVSDLIILNLCLSLSVSVSSANVNPF